MHGSIFTNSSSYIVLDLYICVIVRSYIRKRQKTAASLVEEELDFFPSPSSLTRSSPVALLFEA